jgi:hypothetical protein
MCTLKAKSKQTTYRVGDPLRHLKARVSATCLARREKRSLIALLRHSEAIFSVAC